MQSLPVALAAGIGVGVLEQVLDAELPDSGSVELALFVVILGCAAVPDAAPAAASEERGGWASGAAVAAACRRAAQLARSAVPRKRYWLASRSASRCSLPLVASNQTATTLTVILAVGLVGLSVGIVTGLGGQLSLGQFALAGVGAAVSIHMANWTGNFPLAFLSRRTGHRCGVGCHRPARPAHPRAAARRHHARLRARAPAAGCCSRAGCSAAASTPDGRSSTAIRSTRGKRTTSSPSSCSALCILLARNVWRSGLGRRLRALRDNEDGARAFSVPRRG